MKIPYILISIVLSCFFLSANSGHIYSQDVIISPNNKNNPSDITFIFTLDTSLAATDYLRIVLPFKLNSIQPGVWAPWSMDASCSITGTSMLAVVTASSVDTNTYFVQFYSDNTQTTLSGLTANTAYYLTITGTPDSSSSTGINLPIELYTVSDITTSEYIIYDSNPTFGTITLADPFASTMVVSRSIPSADTAASTVLGGTYRVNVDITPKTTLRNRARVYISLTNTAFSLISCTSIASTADKIVALTASYTSINAYTIRATVTQTLTAGNGAKYRFQCQVRNPTLPGTTRVQVQNRYGYIDTITESGTDSVGLQAATTGSSGSSSSWSETNHQVQLGWGYPASSATALGIFSLYKDANAVERWYQSAKTIFQPLASMTSTAVLQVVVFTVSDPGFQLLTASIYHNLPAYTGMTVTCSQIVQGKLTCQNVGQLQAQSYFVSFKFNLLSTTTTLSVADFGKVQVETQAASPVVLLPVSQTTLTNKAIATNVALFTSSQTNGIIANSVTNTGSTTTTYVTNGEAISLQFTFNYFANTWISNPLTTAVINKGIEFYTSQNLASVASPLCSIKTLGITDVLLSDCGVQSLTSFTRLRFRLGNFASVTAAVSAQFPSSVTTGTIVFGNVQFSASQFSSLNYVSTDTYDYYARWVQDFTPLNPTIVTATLSSPFFFNSLVYKNAGLANLNVGTTFFATGTTSGVYNTGADFPTLIRITGYLSASEQAGASRLLVFFNDLEPLNPTTPCFGATNTVCKYNANGLDNTNTDTLTDYSGSRRIEISTTDITGKFNIYIPVATVATKTSIGFFVAVASTVSAAASAQGIYATTFSKRINQYTSSATTFTVNAAGSGPVLSITGTPTMGTSINPTVGSVASGYITATPNSGSAVGAAYGYCANYDFTTASGFTLQTYYSSGATPEQYCVSLSYPFSASVTVTCNVCPVHSAMSAGTLSTTAFTMPTMAGVDLYKLAYVVGTNNGNFKNAAYDSQSNKLSPLTLSSTSITFMPLTLNQDGKNVYAQLKFTVVSALPQKIQINLTPSSGNLMMAPVTGVSCSSTTVTITSCTPSGTNTNIQLLAIATTKWGVDEHIINFLVDSTASGLGSDATVSYGMTITVDGVTSLSAIHHRTTSSYTYTVSSATTAYITLSDISYLFGTQSARTIIKFTFELPAEVSLYAAQELHFNLGDIAAANSGESPVCVVRDATTLEATNDFATCDTTDLTSLILKAKNSASGAYVLELGFIKVPSSAAPAGITCTLVAVDGSTTVAQSDPSNPLALPTASPKTDTPAINIVYNRLYADAGSVSEIVLTVKPSVLPINVQSNVYIYFPQYYPGKLGYQNIWCTASDLPLPCTLLAERVIQLSSFPVDVAITASVKIKIYGVMTPVVPGTPGKIFIAIDNNSDMFSLTEQIEISDTASNAATPNTLSIDSFSVSTNLIREQADYTIVFTTDAIGVRAAKIISIDFPDRYGNILRGQTGPKIAISKTGSIVTTTVQSSSFGSRFKITLPLNLDPLTSYTFIIKSIDTPEGAVCIMDRPTISVTDSNELITSTRSASNIWNAPTVSYYSDPSLKLLSWTDASGNPVSSVTLSIGIFSAPIRIIPPAGANFINDVTFSISDTTISLLPDSLTATRGSPYLSLRVAASSSSYPGINLLTFTKDESTTTNVYMEIAKLQLTLTNNNKTLPTYPLKIMQGGTSLPYRWQLDTLNLIPNNELKIQASITSAALSPLSIQGASVLTFGPSAQRLGFTFSLAATADPLSPPSFTLTLSGEDSANYVFGTTPNLVTVDVLAPAVAAPTLATLVVTPTYAPTQQEMILTLDQMSSVFWHVAYQGKLTTTDCARIESLFNQGTTYDSSSATQAQYGAFYIYDENVASPQVITNLLSNADYSYILCPSNQLDMMGTATTGTFTTADNTARLDKVDITFTKPITRNQLTILVCLFNTELQLPDRNVVAMDDTSCSQDSVYDDFTSFNYQTVTIWIHGNRASDFTSATSTLLNDYVTSVQSQTPSDFLTAFNTALRSASLTNFYSAITLTVGPTYALPVIDPTSSLTVSANSSAIKISGLKLSSGAGYFFAIASTDLTTAPTPAQIRASLDSTSSTVSSANVAFTSSSVSLTLTDLIPSTVYNIYYYAATADKTQYARVTNVNYVQKSTTKASTVSAPRMEVSILITAVIALFAFLL